MSDFKDIETEEDLRRLEDEHEAERSPEGEKPERVDLEGEGPFYRVKAAHSNETYLASYRPPEGEPAPVAGDMVVCGTRYGRDLCELLGPVASPGHISADELQKIERLSTEADRERRVANEEKERAALKTCREKVIQHRLPMKLVSAHYLLDEPKVLFFFTAESRVDFRELVKDLVSVFKMRIELRQIGVRDEARVTGGCGVCGRVLCCHAVTDRLSPVSIKMAKDQNLSLNSMKISGPCGRLLCCLAYEFGFYREARRSIPPEGSRFNWDGTLFRVTEINVPAGRVRISGEDGRVLIVDASRFVQSEGRWVLKDEVAPKEPDA